MLIKVDEISELIRQKIQRFGSETPAEAAPAAAPEGPAEAAPQAAEPEDALRLVAAGRTGEPVGGDAGRGQPRGMADHHRPPVDAAASTAPANSLE